MSILNLSKGPAEINNELVNPEASIQNFVGAEKTRTGNAWQHPIKDAISDNCTDIKAMVRSTLTPAEASLNIIRSIATETSNAVSAVLSSYIRNPIRIASRTIAAPFAFVFNNVKRAIDATIKLPFSAVNLLGSHLGRPALAASAYMKKGADKISTGADSVGSKIEGISTSVKNKLDKLKIPGVAALEGGHNSNPIPAKMDTGD